MWVALMLGCWSTPAPTEAPAPTPWPTKTGFVPPDETRRQRAIGEVPADWAPYFDLADFEPVPPPMPGDWLAEHPEIGESFAGYVGDPGGRPTAERRTIYVQPMGRPAADLSVVRDLTEAWFGLPVTVGSTVTVERVNPTIRDGQLLTTDIMAWLYGRLPDDAVALVALTGTDLYPDPVWNYVFGQASLTHRVGVWSTARFGEPGSLEARRRLAKIMLHELGHMVGMPHCVWNHCLMNGSNDLTEADRAPLFLGPVCLHKLLWATDQTPTERYRVLAEAYTRHGLDAEAAWVRGRLEAAAR